MMKEVTKYQPMRLTRAGKALLAKTQAGRCNIHMTKFVTGSGTYAIGEDYSLQEGLKEERQEFAITSIEIKTEDTVVLEVVITNMADDGTGIEEGYKIREMAFFAQDPDEGEICYCIMVGTDDMMMDYLPAYDGVIPSIITNYFYIRVANADDMTITVSSGDSVCSQEGANGLRIYDDKIQFLDQNGHWVDMDTSNTVVNMLEVVEEEYPVPAAGDTMKTIIGKVVKFIQDAKAGFCRKSDLVNNATSTDTDKAPTAAQIKMLNDRINQLYSDIEIIPWTSIARDTTNTINIDVRNAYKVGDLFSASIGINFADQVAPNDAILATGFPATKNGTIVFDFIHQNNKHVQMKVTDSGQLSTAWNGEMISGGYVNGFITYWTA